MPDYQDLNWRKSSFSNGNGGNNCVEVAEINDPTDPLYGMLAIRDSKAPRGTTLFFSKDEWAAFIDGVQAGEFG